MGLGEISLGEMGLGELGQNLAELLQTFILCIGNINFGI